MTTTAIICGAVLWVFLAVLAWGLCAIAGRADRDAERARRDVERRGWDWPETWDWPER